MLTLNPNSTLLMRGTCFFTRVQKVDENIDEYVTDLKIKARNCSFGDLKDEMIRDKIICGITSEQLCGRLLRQGDISLDKVLEICRSHEASEKQLKDLNSVKKNSDVAVNVVSSKSEYKRFSSGLAECKFCGYKHVLGGVTAQRLIRIMLVVELKDISRKSVQIRVVEPNKNLGK